MRKNLADARRSKGYAQWELARLCDINERHYRELEAGTTNGSIPVWEALRTLLEAPSIDHILATEDRPP